MISFGWTTAPLLAGVKSWTWREWTAKYASQFHEGDVVDAWDKSPRNGGRKVARLYLRADPILMTTAQLADEDYETEGLAWLAQHPEACPKSMWGKPFTPFAVSREHFDERRRAATPGYKVVYDVREVLVENPWAATA